MPILAMITSEPKKFWNVKQTYLKHEDPIILLFYKAIAPSLPPPASSVDQFWRLGIPVHWKFSLRLSSGFISIWILFASLVTHSWTLAKHSTNEVFRTCFLSGRISATLLLDLVNPRTWASILSKPCALPPIWARPSKAGPSTSPLHGFKPSCNAFLLSMCRGATKGGAVSHNACALFCDEHVPIVFRGGIASWSTKQQTYTINGRTKDRHFSCSSHTATCCTCSRGKYVQYNTFQQKF